MEILFLVGRMILAGFFINSGYNHFAKLKMMSDYTKMKKVPLPAVAVAFTGVMLILGGLSILLGVFPLAGIILLAIFLIPVSIMMHNFWKVQDPMMRAGERAHFMKNMALLGAVLVMTAIPTPWAFSLLN